MMRKTHLVCGIASAAAFTKPDTLLSIAGAVTIGAIGGLICDIDMFSKHNHTNRLGRVITGIIILIIITAVLDTRLNLGIFGYLFGYMGIVHAVGIIGFLVLCVMCMIAEHRKFAHSILAGVLLTLCVALIYPPIAGFFAVGFISHIALDLLNKKPIKLFFPAKKGVCLNLCHADGIANQIFFIVGSVLAIVFVLIRLIALMNI